MAYVAGDPILDDEYNNFANDDTGPTNYSYNHLAGTGSGAYGLGQSALSTVSAGTAITAAQWNSLWTAMDNIANHTNDTLTSTTAVSSGDAIAVKAALQTDLNTLAASVAAGCPNATALVTSSALQTVTTASEGWDTSATQEVSITFADADTLRHFFNAGGKMRITVGTTQAVTSDKDQSFIDLGTALGNIDLASQSTTRSGTGETLTTDGLSNGLHDLTTSYTTLIKLTSDNTNYTSNAIEIQAKVDAAIGTAITVTMKMIATDPSSDTQYNLPNTDFSDQQRKDTPKMITTLYTISPTTGEGLATAPAITSSATVSNTTA
jgi:hypothetical protein